MSSGKTLGDQHKDCGFNPPLTELKQTTTRWVLSETKAIMSPSIHHWMDFFVEEGEIVN